MYAAKQLPKLLPSLVESFAMHHLRPGTMDEQALISYCASCLVLFSLLILLLLLPWLQSFGEMCFLFCCLVVSRLFCAFYSSHKKFALVIHSVLHIR